MRFSLFSLLIFLCFSFASGKDYYGALAINEQTGIAGGSLNYATEDEAIEKAHLSCKNKNGNKGKCKTAINLSNSCGAVAWSPSMKKAKAGWMESSLEGAEQDALLDCRKVGLSDCKVVKSFCTSWETEEVIWW